MRAVVLTYRHYSGLQRFVYMAESNIVWGSSNQNRGEKTGVDFAARNRLGGKVVEGDV